MFTQSNYNAMRFDAIRLHVLICAPTRIVPVTGRVTTVMNVGTASNRNPVQGTQICQPPFGNVASTPPNYQAPPLIVPRVIIELSGKELGLFLTKPGPAIDRLIEVGREHYRGPEYLYSQQIVV